MVPEHMISGYMIQAILFDWGSVLAEPDSKTASLTLAELYSLDAYSIEQFMKQNQSKYDIGDESEEFLDTVAEEFNIPSRAVYDALCEVVPTDVYLSLLPKLEQLNLPIYLASNQKGFKAEFLRANGYLDPFDGIHLSCEMWVKKPDRAFYQKFLEETGLSPGCCLFIDDNHQNVSTAKEMGFNTILHIPYENIFQLRQSLQIALLLPDNAEPVNYFG